MKSNLKLSIILNRWDTPIHVDAASGGFIAPFIYPELEWDFRLPLVKSINVSGHKYGLVYAGIGWVIWRNKEDLPEELIFHINYLGADQPTFTLNFSKGTLRIIYTLICLIEPNFLLHDDFEAEFEFYQMQDLAKSLLSITN